MPDNGLLAIDEPSPPFPALLHRMLGFGRKLLPWLGVAIGILAIIAVRHALHGLVWEDVRASLAKVGPARICLSLLLSVLSYYVLTFYDQLALRIARVTVSWRRTALAAFVGYTFSHNLGAGIVTGGSARFRIYSAGGLKARHIAEVIGIAGVTFWSGVIAVTGGALAVAPHVISFIVPGVAPWLARGIGLSILAGTVVAIALLPRRAELQVWRIRIPLPTRRQAVAQVLLGAGDLLLASGTFFALLPGVPLSSFPEVYLAYSVAVIAVLLSHVPGGVGVFEAVLVATLPAIPKPTLLAALILFRVVYYFLPLLVASLMLLIHESGPKRVPSPRPDPSH